MQRLFISFNLPQEIKHELAAYLLSLRKTIPAIKWVHPEILHITLHFLGDLNASQQQAVIEAMPELAGQGRELTFVIKGLLFLPQPAKARVIALACDEQGNDYARRLQQALGQKIFALGLKIDTRPWRPHITIGRVKRAGAFWRRLPPPPKLKFRLDSFELMASKLSAQGAQHRMLKSYRL